MQRLNDRLLKYILFKIVFVGSILEISSMSVLSIWAGWFSVLGFLKLFSLLSRDRFEYVRRLACPPGSSALTLLHLNARLSHQPTLLLLVPAFCSWSPTSPARRWQCTAASLRCS